MLVCAHDRAVEKYLFKIYLFTQRGKNGLPDALVGPAREAPEYAVPRTEGRWQVSPRSPCSGHPEHCFDEQSVIGTCAPAITFFPVEQRFNPNPLVVTQQQSWHPVFRSKDRM